MFMNGRPEDIFNYESSIISGDIAFAIILAAPFPACILTNLAVVFYYKQKDKKRKKDVKEQISGQKSWFSKLNFISTAVCLIVFYIAAISINYRREDYGSFSEYTFLSLRLLLGLIISAGLGLISSAIINVIHWLLFKKGEGANG